MMTKQPQAKIQIEGVPVTVEIVSRSKAEMDEKVSAAMANKLGFAARPDYVRGVVVVTTDNLNRQIAPSDGYEFEFGSAEVPVASGGERLLSTGANCTSGFRVNGNAVTTAGHCFNNAGTIYPWQGGTQSVGAAFNQVCSSDVQLHAVNGASATTVQGVSISGYAAPYVGMPIRKFGYATGNTAGTVTITGSAWTLQGNGDCPPTPVSGFKSNAPSFPGDSGGPTIVCQNAVCSSAAGVGITSTAFNAGTSSVVLSAALAATGSYLG